jgi:hypothetical protein
MCQHSSATIKEFYDILGENQGTRRAADLTEDIDTLIESLEENNVYRLRESVG